jgi:hypothetical protein
MNYSRRPNRPDANYYRETRRRSMTAGALGSTLGRRRGRGTGLRVLWLLVLLLVGAAALWWFWFKK